MIHKPYPRYRESGGDWIGKVPEHWEVKRLKHIADVHLSNVDKHMVEGQKVVRLCNYLDVYNNRLITSKIDFMSATASDQQIERLSLQKDDVIITKDSEDPSDIGIPALVEEDIFGLVCGYHLAILRPTAAMGNYLHYLLQSTFVRSAFEVEATGMTRYALGKYSIENLTFALPHQSEQTSIASFLDQETSRIDILISEKERLISLLQEYRQALISHAVTKGLNPNVKMKDSGVEWLGKVPEQWNKGRLRWLSRIYSGGTPDKTNQDYWTTGTIPWLNSGAVNQCTITEPSDFISQEAYENSSTKWINPGSLVIALAGQGKTKGMVAQLAIEATCNQSMAAIVPENKITPRFLFWWLTSNYQNIRNLAGGDLRDGLNLELIGDIQCPLPESKEQTIIASFLDREAARIDTLISGARTFIDLLKEYRSSLITAAVIGKIDVRGYHV